MKFKKFVKESFEDMDKRCEACNTLLNDMGKCPKCDEGEEDYGDEVELTEETDVCTCGECEDCLTRENLEEELSNIEKLKRAYPELNFDEPEVIEEEVKCEELSNLEKLKRAYPELDFGEPLTEGTGADTTQMIKNAMTALAKDDKNTWAKTVVNVVDMIPDSLADDLFDTAKDKLHNVKINAEQRKKLNDAAGVETNEAANTIGKVLDFIDTRDEILANPERTKNIVVSALGIAALIEPTPVLEVITLVVEFIPAPILAKILAFIQTLNPVILGSEASKLGSSIANNIQKNDTNEELNELFDLDLNVSDLVKVDGGTGNSVPFLGGTSNIDTNESIEEDNDPYADYDDDYDFDDVEEDHLHSSLYGGDRTYCSCGRRLIRDEWGGYCPVCDAEEEEIDRMYHDADEEELRRMGAFDNMYDDEFEYDDNI